MRGVIGVLVGIVAAALLSGWGVAMVPSRGPGDPASAQAVRELVAGSESVAMPPGFAATEGYLPVVRDGALLRADGGCSSPLAGTGFDVEAVCARHDLGYDLLRHAARGGDPLGGWARRAIDHQFAAGLTSRCAELRGGLPCLAEAGLYTTVVRLNTWRQGDGAPMTEDSSRWSGALMGGAAVGLQVRGRRRPSRAGRATAAAVRRAARRFTAAGSPAGAASLRSARRAATAARRRVRPLAPEGLVGAVVAAVPALTVAPVLPLAPAVHGLVGGIVAVHGYAAGVAVVALGRTAVAPGVRAAVRRCARWAVAGAAVVGTVLDPLPVAVALVVLAVAVLVARGARRAVRLPRPVIALGLVVSLLVGLPAAASAAEQSGPVGPEGRAFLAGTGAGVRVYAGLGSGATLQERVRDALAGLDRAGGFARSTLLVVVPTGSGWVNPDAVTTLERLTGGDVSTVVLQYSQRPSWQVYAFDPGAATESSVALVEALRARLDTMPAASRPRLLVYGESLGAIGARAAAAGADAVLVAGTPGSAWGPVRDRGVTAVLHPDDPVGWFSPLLLVARPDGWRGPWIPVVSFWTTAGSLLAALDVPPGHGHRYAGELADGWRAVAAGADVSYLSHRHPPPES